MQDRRSHRCATSGCRTGAHEPLRSRLAAAGGMPRAEPRVGWVSRTPALRQRDPPLPITGLNVTPIALPDPPLLAASGCHGPYFLRNIVELRTEGGIVGIGETHGGESVTTALERAEKLVIGQNAFALSEICAGITGARDGLLRGDRDGMPRRLRPGDGPPFLRAAWRTGPRLGRVRGLSVLPLCRRSSGRSGRSRTWSIRAAGATVPRLLGRGPDSRGDGRDGRGSSATAGAFGSSSSRGACWPRTSSATP